MDSFKNEMSKFGSFMNSEATLHFTSQPESKDLLSCCNCVQRGGEGGERENNKYLAKPFAFYV